MTIRSLHVYAALLSIILLVPAAVAQQRSSDGACCFESFPGQYECFVVSYNDCLANGGAYAGDGIDCNADGSCPNAGACCYEMHGAAPLNLQHPRT